MICQLYIKKIKSMINYYKKLMNEQTTELYLFKKEKYVIKGIFCKSSILKNRVTYWHYVQKYFF